MTEQDEELSNLAVDVCGDAVQTIMRQVVQRQIDGIAQRGGSALAPDDLPELAAAVEFVLRRAWDQAHAGALTALRINSAALVEAGELAETLFRLQWSSVAAYR